MHLKLVCSILKQSKNRKKSYRKSTKSQINWISSLIGYSAIQLDSAQNCNLQLESESHLVGLLLAAPVVDS